ncbi:MULTISPECIES: hypothetical protein [unclassified Bradyrhizobium]|nr:MULTISPECIES: hypothetical protein [unclassified Bradyrhizobium]
MAGAVKGELSPQETELVKQLRELLPELTKQVKEARDKRVDPKIIKKK